MAITTPNPKEGEAQAEEVIGIIKESILKDKGTFEVEKSKK